MDAQKTLNHSSCLNSFRALNATLIDYFQIAHFIVLNTKKAKFQMSVIENTHLKIFLLTMVSEIGEEKSKSWFTEFAINLKIISLHISYFKLQ